MKNLQVDAIIGMDFMSKNKVTIDTSTRRIHIPPWKLQGPAEPRIPFRETPYSRQTLSPSSEYDVMVISDKSLSIPPIEEQQVTFKMPTQLNPKLSKALFTSDEKYHDELIFMDGVVDPQGNQCSTVVLNKSNRSIHLPKHSPIGIVSTDPETLFADYHEVFSIQKGKPTLTDTSHVPRSRPLCKLL